MGYSMQNGRWANTLPCPVIPAAAPATLTATANSAGLELGDRGTARLKLNVTAASGTNPTLTVQMQTSPDNATWTNLGAAFTQATGVTSQSQIFSGVDRFIRAVSTLGGTTPSFTFSVDGEAV